MNPRPQAPRAKPPNQEPVDWRARSQGLEKLLNEALIDFLAHQSWRCGHPDRYSHDPDCPCGLVDFENRAEAALGLPDEEGEGR